MDPLSNLFALNRFGIKPGLDTIRELTRAMGDPQLTYRCLIVAGTNGKGSVVAMVDAALRSAGYRVGRYTSPHLRSVTERFVVDNTAISESVLRREAASVQAHSERLVASGRLPHPPTFFEATTAIAFSWFRRARVDLALLEVGLGGQFDATNVVNPLAGVITSIGLDHQDYLGHTLEKIANEKAGIIKPGMVVVTTEQRPELVAVFNKTCQKRRARLVEATRDTVVTAADGGLTAGKIKITTPQHAYRPLQLGLAGAHPVTHALGAVRLMESLTEFGVPIAPGAIVNGLTTVTWPGRLDLVQSRNAGTILFDAAHNPAAAVTLSAYLRNTFPGGLPIVLSVMDDKDVDGIVLALLPNATRIICTAPVTPRAIPPAELATRVRRLAGSLPVAAAMDPLDAIRTIRRGADTVCVTGSIFLVGELLAATEPSRPEA